MPQSDMSLASKRATYRHLQGRLSKLEKEQEQLMQVASAVKQSTRARFGGLLALGIILILGALISGINRQNMCVLGALLLGIALGTYAIGDRMNRRRRREADIGKVSTRYEDNQRAIAELEANMCALEQEIDDALTARREGG